MKLSGKLSHLLALSLPILSVSVSVMAADLNVKLDIPQLDVAEYHRPYVAVWLERPDQSFAGNLAVLYDVKKKDNGGAKYLKDIRQWWRKSGRDLQVPVDGVTGATRAPGNHTLAFAATHPSLRNLPAGDYQLVVEAAREGGGRELVRVPFQWPAKTTENLNAKGKEELGTVSLQANP